MKQYYVYIMTNRSMTLYIGVTNDLQRRMLEHKSGHNPGFTSKYKLDILVFFEETTDVNAAISREKQVKKWSRAKKVQLIQQSNPEWLDLSTSLEMTAGATGAIA